MICPLLGICPVEVSFKHYQEVCSNVRVDKFKECEHFKKITKEAKTPSEWRKVLTPPPRTPISPETWSPGVSPSPPKKYRA